MLTRDLLLSRCRLLNYDLFGLSSAMSAGRRQLLCVFLPRRNVNTGLIAYVVATPKELVCLIGWSYINETAIAYCSEWADLDPVTDFEMVLDGRR